MEMEKTKPMPPARYKKKILNLSCQAPERKEGNKFTNKATKKATQDHFSKLIQDNKNNPQSTF